MPEPLLGPPEPSLDDVRRILADARTVAVLGAHPDTNRPANYVPAYLAGQGYRVLPVNPKHVGGELFGERIVAVLPDLQVPIDVVDVFRRSEQVPAHLDQILGMRPLPKVVWLQHGIRNDAVAERLREAGIEVVQDRCMYADHRKLGIGRVG
jgi:predicted CoA-binding protein